MDRLKSWFTGLPKQSRMAVAFVAVAALILAADCAFGADIPSHVKNTVSPGDFVQIIGADAGPEYVGNLSLKGLSGEITVSCWALDDGAWVKRMPEAASPDSVFTVAAGDVVNLSPLWDATGFYFGGTGSAKLIATTAPGQ